MRLDEALFNQNLVESRNKAKTLIEAGKVTVNGKIVSKASKRVSDNDLIELLEVLRFVSRAGEKLENFLKERPISIENKRCLDVGASTGGFTDCLLQRGAAHVTCVDVGHDQLHRKIAESPKVVNIEGVNAKNIDTIELPYKTYEIAVIDVSFISLTYILEQVWGLVEPGGVLIALVKPQFEVGKAIIQKNKGVIKDKESIELALNKVRSFITENLTEVTRYSEEESSLPGSDGNIEFLIALDKKTN